MAETGCANPSDTGKGAAELERLIEYADHKDTCNYRAGGDCDCGFVVAIRAARKGSE